MKLRLVVATATIALGVAGAAATALAPDATTPARAQTSLQPTAFGEQASRDAEARDNNLNSFDPSDFVRPVIAHALSLNAALGTETLPEQDAAWDPARVDVAALDAIAELEPRPEVPAYWQLRTAMYGVRIALADNDPYWANTARIALRGFEATVGIDTELAKRAAQQGLPFRPNTLASGDDAGTRWVVPTTSSCR
jgi:hypothetical protein